MIKEGELQRSLITRLRFMVVEINNPSPSIRYRELVEKFYTGNEIRLNLKGLAVALNNPVKENSVYIPIVFEGYKIKLVNKW